MRVNEGLVVRHVEDVAFLWARRRDILQTAQLTHGERAQIEARLEAHIEGALLAGEAGRRVALGRLAEAPVVRGSVFAAAVVTLPHADRRPFEQLVATAHDRDASTEIVTSLGWSPLADVEPILLPWIEGSNEWLLSLALAGLAAHRRCPGAGLTRGLRARDPGARTAAAKAAMEMGELQYRGALHDLLVDRDPLARLEAARALARFGDARLEVTDALMAASESGQPSAHEAVAALVRLTPAEGPSLFRRWAAEGATRRLALTVAATHGTREVAEALIPFMADDGIARTVGEAFRAIVGGDLASAALARTPPLHVPGDPTDNPDDPSVELPLDYALPFPSAEKVAAWWAGDRERLLPGIRYLDGRPVGLIEDGSPSADQMGNLRKVARTGRPRHQTMAARALAQARPALPTIETHAFTTDTHPLPGWEAWQDT